MSSFANNKNTKVEKLNNEIIDVFKKINNQEPNLHDLLWNLSKNFENKKKKTNYEEDFIKYINLVIGNDKKDTFNRFFCDYIKIIIPTPKLNGSKPTLTRMNSKTNLNSGNIQIIRKNHYKFIYNNEKEIPFEFQTIISLDLDENIKKNILVFVNIIRKYYVDRLLEILTNYFFYQCNNAHSLDFSCSVVAVGSTAITSNYNVTISGIIYPHKIVNQFNSIFEKFWHNYSSNVFDTNVYGSTFFLTLPSSFEITNNSLKRIIYNGYNELQIKNQNNKLEKRILYLPPKLIGNPNTYSKFLKEIYISQYKWLMLKIDLHKKEYAIKEDELSTNLNKILLLLYKIITNTNIKNTNIPDDYINNIYQEKFKKNKNEIFMNNKSNNSYQEERRKMYQYTLEDIEADQLRYESAILEFSQNQTQNQNKKQNQILGILDDLINSISRSNYYGSETYLCMGTIYHILGFIQKLGDFYMKDEYFITSSIENYIDMYRYYQKMKNDPEYAIIKMSKYTYRIYDALSRLIKSNSQNTLNVKNIKNRLELFGTILKTLKGAHHFDANNKEKLFNSFIYKKNVITNSNINVQSNKSVTVNEPNVTNLPTNQNTNKSINEINESILKTILDEIFNDLNIFLLNFISKKSTESAQSTQSTEST